MSTALTRLMLSSLVVGGLIFSACQPSTDYDELSPVAKTFRTNCQTCHSLKKPDSRTDEEWAVTFVKHADRTKLTEEQLDQLLKFLQDSNKSDTLLVTTSVGS